MTTLLDFRARWHFWQCGHSYRIRRNGIGTYESSHYDWRNGWVSIDIAPYTQIPHLNPHTIQEAIINCTQHALQKGWYKYCPKEPEYLTLAGAAAAAASALAAAAGL
jgi:hypothetical protein